MNTHKLKLFALCFALTQINPAQAARYTIKCWKNQDDIKECGSVVPPEYATKGYNIIDPKSGKVDTVAPQKSEAEIKAELAKVAQEKADKEAAKKAAEEKEAEDKKLLDQFPTENDIHTARNSKMAAIAADVSLKKGQIETWEKYLVDAQGALENTDLQQTTEAIRQRIGNLKGRIKKLEEAIAAKEKEKQLITKEYNDYLQKYRQVGRRVAIPAN
ncbi:MAG: hypothetical protein GY862_26380 [Gammaproteobacteria bacterium]|nr:hypothetical protein [Gammaproteobacteria bacterium]